MADELKRAGFAGDTFTFDVELTSAQAALTVTAVLFNSITSIPADSVTVVKNTATVTFDADTTAELVQGRYNIAVTASGTGTRETVKIFYFEVFPNPSSPESDMRTPARVMLDALTAALKQSDVADQLMYAQKALGDMNLTMADILKRYQQLKSIVAYEESQQDGLINGTKANYVQYQPSFRW